VNAVLKDGTPDLQWSGEAYFGGFLYGNDRIIEPTFRPGDVESYQGTLSGPVPIPDTVFFLSGRAFHVGTAAVALEEVAGEIAQGHVKGGIGVTDVGGRRVHDDRWNVIVFQRRGCFSTTSCNKHEHAGKPLHRDPPLVVSRTVRHDATIVRRGGHP
jgi:hypothetical protein